MDVLELPNGVCNKLSPRGIPHGMKINVEGDAVCLKCRSEAEQAARTVVPVNIAQDPGADAFQKVGNGVHLKADVKRAGGATIAMVNLKDNAQVGTVPVAQETEKRYVGEAGVADPGTKLALIKAAIYGLPMPKSMAQYKRFLKIQQLIDQCISEEENG